MRLRLVSLFMICLWSVAWTPIALAEDASRAGQSQGTGARPQEGKPSDDAAPGNRKRWDQLSPEQRKRLEKMFERLKETPPAERQRLIERLRAVDAQKRQAVLQSAKRELEKDSIERDVDRERRRFVENQLRRLPAEEQERLKKLSPEERGRWITQRIEQRRQRLVSQLPPRLRERVEKLPPHEQIQLIQRLQGERAFKQTFADTAEVEKIRSMKPREVRDALRAAASSSPPLKPEWMSEATWSRWLALRPFERSRALSALFNPRADVQQLEPGSPEKRRKSFEKRF